jgi:hypothetical protein
LISSAEARDPEALIAWWESQSIDISLPKLYAITLKRLFPVSRDRSYAPGFVLADCIGCFSTSHPEVENFY